ncbi:MAG: hypothetical protein V1866_03890 [archaeon]
MEAVTERRYVDSLDRNLDTVYELLAVRNLKKLRKEGIEFHKEGMVYVLPSLISQIPLDSGAGKAHYEKIFNNLIGHAARTVNHSLYHVLANANVFPFEEFDYKRVVLDKHKGLDELVFSGDEKSIDCMINAGQMILADYIASRDALAAEMKRLKNRAYSGIGPIGFGALGLGIGIALGGDLLVTTSCGAIGTIIGLSAMVQYQYLDDRVEHKESKIRLHEEVMVSLNKSRLTYAQKQ